MCAQAKRATVQSNSTESSLYVLVGVQHAGEREHAPLRERPRGLQNFPACLEGDHHAWVDGNLRVCVHVCVDRVQANAAER